MNLQLVGYRIDLSFKSGLSRRIDMGEYKSCGDPPVSPKPDYLLIKVNSNGFLQTSVGNQIYAEGQGPTMNFDPSPAVGMQNPVGNMVHEVGLVVCPTHRLL